MRGQLYDNWEERTASTSIETVDTDGGRVHHLRFYDAMGATLAHFRLDPDMTLHRVKAPLVVTAKTSVLMR